MRIRVPGVLVHHLAYGLSSTWAITRLHEERAEAAQRLVASGAAVGVFWHQSLFMAAACHHHRHVAALASRSADGGLVAEHLRRIGIRTVRGSSRNGAAVAARELMRAIEDGWMIALACDGPKGPIFVPKTGAPELARRHQVPLVPIGFGANRFSDVAPAWDRFRVPWPGTRIACVYGDPIMYPPAEPDPDEMQRRLTELAARLDALQHEAMAAVGRRR